jgi:serine/threonine protein kinase
MKPANLLLHNRRIKIGDLGFSKSISVHEEILTSTVGTPLYMSPQILSNTTYTEKTDVWSLGILLYEMLVGEVPWRVNSIQ